jgi:hypothetical protein
MDINQNFFEVFFYTCGTEFSADAKLRLCPGHNSPYPGMAVARKGFKINADQTFADV